jgi:hypothetical protein
MLTPGARRGRRHIIVDEWGPYDYNSPKLWPIGRADANPLKLAVLGPPGRWKVSSRTGVKTLSRTTGDVPGELDVTLADGRVVDLDLELTYTGRRIVTPFGQVIPAGRPSTFGYDRFFAPIDWTVRFFQYGEGQDVLADGAFEKITGGAVVREEKTERLDYMSSRALAEGLPRDRVALTAEGRVDLPPGEFDLVVVSDDGVRVWVDDVRVIDHWRVHESAVDRVRISGGRRRLKVHYFEATGWAELKVDVVRPGRVAR